MNQESIESINNMIVTTKTIETSWKYESTDTGIDFSKKGSGSIFMKSYCGSSSRFTPEEFDRLIDGMTAFRDALKDNKKIPEKEFIVSEEDAEAAIAMTYKEDV